MKNGLTIARTRAGLTKAELARKAGIDRQHITRLENYPGPNSRKMTKEWADRLAPFLNCSGYEILYPQLADLDHERFYSVFDIAEDEEHDGEPRLAFQHDLLARMWPQGRRHTLRLFTIEDDDMHNHLRKGDVVIVDMDDTSPTRPGLYVVDMGGAPQWRYLSPTASGQILIRADNPGIPEERVSAEELTVIGRGRLRISTI